MISFFVLGSLFLIFATISEVKQNLIVAQLKVTFLVWFFGGHLNNASEPYFLMEPPLWKLNDECSGG